GPRSGAVIAWYWDDPVRRWFRMQGPAETGEQRTPNLTRGAAFLQCRPFRRLDVEATDDLHDPPNVLRAQVRAGGQAQSAREQVFRDRAPPALAPVEHRLQVHRFPDGPRLDVLGLQGEPHLFPRGAELLGTDRQRGE